MGRQSLSAAFAKVIRQQRLAKHVSQEHLAHEAGLHPTYVGLIERGLRNPTLDTGHALARALDTTLSRLIWEAERTL
jgi:transcriptional regulator with XRE-family HTH domain